MAHARTPHAPLAIGHDDARAQHATSVLQERLAEAVRLRGADSEASNLAASLGRALAEDGATPTFASTVLDPLAPEPVLRAALLEAYCAAREGVRAHLDAQRWEFPGSAVRVGERRYAVCANPPHDDDAAAAWADRVAARLVKLGAREVVLSGRGRPRERLEEALELVGIGWHDEESPPPKGGPWLRFPWSKRG